MKYVYINSSENKVTLISNRIDVSGDSDENLTRYAVPDDFDMTKDMGGEILEGFLTADEFLERRNADYVALRVGEYPPLEEQLDNIFHNGIDAWKSDIQSIKDRHPKPE